MKIVHEFWKCTNCGEVLEITDEDRLAGEMYCECGYEMEFEDFRFETWEEEY